MISPQCPVFPAIYLDIHTYNTAGKHWRRGQQAAFQCKDTSMAQLHNLNAKFPLPPPREVLKECSLGELPEFCVAIWGSWEVPMS